MIGIMAAVCILYGVLILRFALTNNEAFFNNRASRRIVSSFGRRGAVIFYTILGAAGLLIGVAALIFSIFG